MKIQAIQCPNCKANLQLGGERKTPNGVYYCQYCGTPIHIDDGVKRSEHTYRKVDVARILEAENEKDRIIAEQKERKSQSIIRIIKLLPVLIIVLLIAFSCHNRSVNKKKQAALYNEIKGRVVSITNEYNMEVNSLRISNDKADLRIETNTFEKTKVDVVDEKLVSLFNEYDFKSVRIAFEDDYRTVRYTDINEFGKIERWGDNTNNSSDEERGSIITEYSDAVNNMFKNYNYPVVLEKTQYENDHVVLTLKTETTYSESLNAVENDIVDLSKTLSQQKLRIVFSTSIYGLLRETIVSEEGNLTRKTDYSNKYTDEEQAEIVNEYKKAISTACKFHHANVGKMFIWADSLRVNIKNTTKEKKTVDSLQNRIVKAIKSCTPIVIEIEFDENDISTARRITIDENREVDVGVDFTK